MLAVLGLWAVLATTDAGAPSLGPADEDLVYFVHNLHLSAVALAERGRRAPHPRIRALARRLAREHAQHDRRLVTWARAHGVPDGTLADRGGHVDVDTKHEVEALGHATPEEHGRMFLDAALRRLEQWTAALEIARGRAVDPELRRHIERVLPILERQRRLGENLRPEAS